MRNKVSVLNGDKCLRSSCTERCLQRVWGMLMISLQDFRVKTFIHSAGAVCASAPLFLDWTYCSIWPHQDPGASARQVCVPSVPCARRRAKMWGPTVKRRNDTRVLRGLSQRCKCVNNHFGSCPISGESSIKPSALNLEHQLISVLRDSLLRDDGSRYWHKP